MAKNRENNGILGDLVMTAKTNIAKRNTLNTHDTHDTHDSGRRQKHPRINLAFYGENLEYVREAAFQERMSVTEYVNQLIVDDRNRKLAGFKNSATKQMSIDDVDKE